VAVEVVEPQQRRLPAGEAVFDNRAHHAGRAFGPQREEVVVVGERVHLLLDDVGRLTDGPDEQGRRLSHPLIFHTSENVFTKALF